MQVRRVLKREKAQRLSPPVIVGRGDFSTIGNRAAHDKYVEILIDDKDDSQRYNFRLRMEVQEAMNLVNQIVRELKFIETGMYPFTEEAIYAANKEIAARHGKISTASQ